MHQFITTVRFAEEASERLFILTSNNISYNRTILNTDSLYGYRDNFWKDFILLIFTNINYNNSSIPSNLFNKKHILYYTLKNRPSFIET